MKMFDPHIHMTSRTTDDYQAMAAAGIAAIVEPAFWLGQPHSHVGTFEDYFLSLLGWEVKSLRAGRVQLKEAYVFLKDAEAFLFGAHVSALPTASTHVIPDPIRTRKLLLNRSELNRLVGAVER